MKKPQLRKHYPALDGLRALAVFSVLAYHQNFGWAQGGYLGVSVFFTLSGYLITSLILVERDQSGGLNYGAFTARRAKRLVPATVAGVAVACIFGAIVAEPHQQRHLGGDVGAALSYLSNWRYIVQDIGYGDIFGAPSPLVHFWSLAIEAQFYVVFPLVMLIAMKWARGRFWPVPALIVGLWLASIASSLVLQNATIDRIYFGTDTRSSELLSGSILALVYRQITLKRQAGITPTHRALNRSRAIWGVAALAVLTYLVVNTPLESPWLYRGGFTIISGVSAVVIWSLLAETWLATAVGWRPFRWIGLRSYGLYVYHWPLFLWLSPGRVGLDGWFLFILRVTLSVILADISFRYLETPLRRMSWDKPWQIRLTPVPFGVLGVAAVVITLTAPPPVLHFDESDPVLPEVVVDQNIIAVWGGALASELASSVTATVAERSEVEILNLSQAHCDSFAEPSCAQVAWRWLRGARAVSSVIVLVGPDDPFGQSPDQLSFLRALLDDTVQVTWITHPPVLSPDEYADAVTLPVDAVSALDYQSDTIEVLATRFGDRLIDMSRLVEPPPQGYPPERVVMAYLPGDPALSTAVQSVAREVVEGVRASAATWRIMVVGDSIAQSLGWGFSNWAEKSGRAFVWNVARPGCALIRDGELRDRGEMPEGCRSWANDFPQYVNDFSPDLVVVHAGPWDSKRRRFTGRNEFVEPDDAQYMDLMREDYALVTELLSSGGAPVLWLNMPCVHPREVAEQAVFNPERRVPQRQVLDELVDQLPELYLYDLDALVCPAGNYQDQLGDVADSRPDGVHFSPAGAEWVVEQLLPTIEDLINPNN